MLMNNTMRNGFAQQKINPYLYNASQQNLFIFNSMNNNNNNIYFQNPMSGLHNLNNFNHPFNGNFTQINNSNALNNFNQIYRPMTMNAMEKSSQEGFNVKQEYKSSGNQDHLLLSQRKM